jgi:hypothetical protein
MEVEGEGLIDTGPGSHSHRSFAKVNKHGTLGEKTYAWASLSLVSGPLT